MFVKDSKQSGSMPPKLPFTEQQKLPKNQSSIQSVMPLMFILATCLKITITWPYTLRLYLKTKPIGKWEDKTNIVDNLMRSFFFTSALTTMLYVSCGSNHSPPACIIDAKGFNDEKLGVDGKSKSKGSFFYILPIIP
jgi:hypothetical protein